MSYDRGHVYSTIRNVMYRVLPKKKSKKEASRARFCQPEDVWICWRFGIPRCEFIKYADGAIELIILSRGFTNMLLRTNVISTFTRLASDVRRTQPNRQPGADFCSSLTLFVWHARRTPIRFPYTLSPVHTEATYGDRFYVAVCWHNKSWYTFLNVPSIFCSYKRQATKVCQRFEFR